MLAFHVRSSSACSVGDGVLDLTAGARGPGSGYCVRFRAFWVDHFIPSRRCRHQSVFLVTSALSVLFLGADHSVSELDSGGFPRFDDLYSVLCAVPVPSSNPRWLCSLTQ